MGYQRMHASSVEIHQLKQINFWKKPLGQLSKAAVLKVKNIAQEKLGIHIHPFSMCREEERAYAWAGRVQHQFLRPR